LSRISAWAQTTRLLTDTNTGTESTDRRFLAQEPHSFLLRQLTRDSQCGKQLSNRTAPGISTGVKIIYPYPFPRNPYRYCTHQPTPKEFPRTCITSILRMSLVTVSRQLMIYNPLPMFHNSDKSQEPSNWHMYYAINFS
jgi:hypothetical protein